MVIRPLERADLTSAATLYDVGFRDGPCPADPAIADILERILFGNPWADPELPSLIATDDQGRAVGFIGAIPRRMRLGGRPVRLVVASHFVVDPAARHQGRDRAAAAGRSEAAGHPDARAAPGPRYGGGKTILDDHMRGVRRATGRGRGRSSGPSTGRARSSRSISLGSGGPCQSATARRARGGLLTTLGNSRAMSGCAGVLEGAS